MWIALIWCASCKDEVIISSSSWHRHLSHSYRLRCLHVRALTIHRIARAHWKFVFIISNWNTHSYNSSVLNKVLSIWFGRSGSNTIAFYKKRVRIYHCVSKCVVFIVIAPLSLSSAATSVFPWWCWIVDDFAFCFANSLLVCWVGYIFYLCELWVNRVLGSLIAVHNITQYYYMCCASLPTEKDWYSVRLYSFGSV